MDRKRFLWITLMFITMPLRTSFAADKDIILEELKRLEIKIVGSAKRIEVQLPTVLIGPDLGLKKTICEQSGYDLSAYAGKKVLFTAFPISEEYTSEPLNVWVISFEDKIVCVYKTVREGSVLVPGIFAIETPNTN